MSSAALCELYDEMDSLVRELSEELVLELARRDELEYEKELKNQFISLLLSVQRRHRALVDSKLRGGASGASSSKAKDTPCTGSAQPGCVSSIFWTSSFIDSAPRLGVYYFLSFTLSVCISVCLSVTLLLQIDSSFLFLDGIKPFFDRWFSMWHSTKLFFDFCFRPLTPIIYPKICMSVIESVIGLHKITYTSVSH